MENLNRRDEGTCIGCNGTGVHEDPETCERNQCAGCQGSGNAPTDDPWPSWETIHKEENDYTRRVRRLARSLSTPEDRRERKRFNRRWQARRFDETSHYRGGG